MPEKIEQPLAPLHAPFGRVRVKRRVRCQKALVATRRVLQGVPRPPGRDDRFLHLRHRLINLLYSFGFATHCLSLSGLAAFIWLIRAVQQPARPYAPQRAALPWHFSYSCVFSFSVARRSAVGFDLQMVGSQLDGGTRAAEPQADGAGYAASLDSSER